MIFNGRILHKFITVKVLQQLLVPWVKEDDLNNRRTFRIVTVQLCLFEGKGGSKDYLSFKFNVEYISETYFPNFLKGFDLLMRIGVSCVRIMFF